MTKTILVTGASGFIGAHIVEQLLTTTNYTIRGTVRNASDASKTSHLTSFPHAPSRLELISADLLTEGAFDDAARECDAVIHTASPYTLTVKDPQRDLVDPAEQGTLNVLRAARKAGTVKIVVVTSSVAAMSDEPVKGHVLTEADWNMQSTLKRNPYYFSKTRGERVAWEFMELPENKDAFRLVAINPFITIGPSHTRTINPSAEVFCDIAMGKMPGIIDISFGYVDVRDVAHAHIQAVEIESAQGRYLCAAETWNMKRIVTTMKKEFPGYSYPSYHVPAPLVYMFSFLESSGKGSVIRSHVGKEAFVFDNSKIKRDLGIEFRPVETSIEEMVKDLQQWGNVPKEKVENK